MNWKKEKVSSFAKVVTGGTPSTAKKDFWDGGTIPWINSGDLNQRYVTKVSNFITEAGYKSSSTKLMPPNSVLIALTGATTGLTALLKVEACANQSVTGILPSLKHHPEFLYYYFRTQRQKILNATWGGAQPHINQKYLKDYLVPLPAIHEQQNIATILESADKLIEQRKETIKLLEHFVKSTFLKMFGDPSHNVHKFRISKIRNLVDEVKYGTSKPSEETGELPYLRMNNITTTGYWDFTSLKYININESEEEKYVVRKGDVIFNRTNSKELVGKTAVYDDDRKMVIAGYLIRIRTNKTANPWYIWGYLNSNHGKQTLFGMCKSIVGMANINAQELQEIQILVPPIELQNSFAEIVYKTEAIKKHYIESLAELEKLFAALSQKAFNEKLNLGSKKVLEEYSSADNDRTKPRSVEFKRAGVGTKVENKKKTETVTKVANQPKSKILWEQVSSQQIAEWIKEKYSDNHFSSEMLTNFLMNDHVTFPDYYSSEDLKKKPYLNGAEDLKSFVFSAISKQNPFIKFEQFFYDAEKENFVLELTGEDYELIKSREPKERSGIYFRISTS